MGLSLLRFHYCHLPPLGLHLQSHFRATLIMKAPASFLLRQGSVNPPVLAFILETRLRFVDSVSGPGRAAEPLLPLGLQGLESPPPPTFRCLASAELTTGPALFTDVAKGAVRRRTALTLSDAVVPLVPISPVLQIQTGTFG